MPAACLLTAFTYTCTAAISLHFSSHLLSLTLIRLDYVAPCCLLLPAQLPTGEYISVASQKDAEEADIEKERAEQRKGPEAQQRELEELTQIYVDVGGKGLWGWGLGLGTRAWAEHLRYPPVMVADSTLLAVCK